MAKIIQFQVVNIGHASGRKETYVLYDDGKLYVQYANQPNAPWNEVKIELPGPTVVSAGDISL